MGSFREIILLSLLASASLFISNFLLDGSLNSTANLSGELKSHPDSLYQWRIGNEAPFKYRVIHKAIVLTTFNLVSHKKKNNELFFTIYRSYAVLFHILSILIFRYFLRKIDMAQVALAGAAIFAILPPLLMAYNVPLHTREDTLGYIILIAGLLAIIKNNTASIILTMLIGILCRETLLLLPFINLFFNKKQNLWIRLSLVILGFGVFFLIRIIVGITKYDYWEGLNWNLSNIEQVVGFGYITFGFLWLPFFLSFKKGVQSSPYTTIITQSGISVFILIVVTTFVGGIFNEIRLLYLLSPWVIVTSLLYYLENKNGIKSIFRLKWYRIFLITTFLFALFAIVIFFIYARQLSVSKYDISYKSWITIGFVQAYLGIVSLPISFKIYRLKTQ